MVFVFKNSSLCLIAMLLPHMAIAAGKEVNPSLDDVTQSETQILPKSPVSGPISIEQSIRLRRDLDEYSKAVDPAHVQIEERRRVMHQRVQARFNEADRDNDGYISRSEALDSLPQVVRHFTYVDENGDNLISLEELEALQARILAQRPVPRFETSNSKVENAKDMAKGEQTALKLDATRLENATDTEALSSKRKNRDMVSNARKRSL